MESAVVDDQVMMLFLNEGSAKFFPPLIVFLVIIGFLIAASVLFDKVADTGISHLN